MEICAIDHTDENWSRPDESPHDWYSPQRVVKLYRINRAEKVNDDLAEQFNALRIAWHKECGLSSSPTEIVKSASYLKIVDMGEKALPFIFEDLRKRPEPDYWFDALRKITKENPVPFKYRGYSRRMAKEWLKWARAHNSASVAMELAARQLPYPQSRIPESDIW
jgi:hypothetical protein